MLARLGFTRSQFITIFVLATILVVLAVVQSQPQTVEPYDPENTGSTGLRALVLWLEELGYPVSLHERETTLADNVGLYWIHATGSTDLSYTYEADVEMAYDWVKQGGTLVVVGPIEYSAVSDYFGVEQVETLTGMLSSIRQVQPLLPNVDANWDSFLAARSLSFYADRAVVPLLAQTTGDPVVAIQTIGKGTVWHLTEDFALTNLNLRDERIASLLPAILRTVPAGAPIVFSTHHLLAYEPLISGPGEVSTLQDWLYTTPFGQATLLVIVTLFAYLLLQGRRLGPALPGPTAARPREAAEYVTALAGLQRRMRQPRVVADHHRQRLKSAVGRLAQLPTDLPDAEWLAQLQRAEVLSPTTLNEITDLLSRYAEIHAIGNGSDEADLIQIVQATDALLASLPRANMQLVR